MGHRPEGGGPDDDDDDDDHGTVLQCRPTCSESSSSYAPRYYRQLAMGVLKNEIAYGTV